MSEIIIGIDLGTTNSEVALVENGRSTIIADSEGRKILPSFVGIGENGEILVGEAARNQYMLYPERTVKSIKRSMGEDIRVDLAGHLYSPQEISAVILKHLKSVAEEYLGQPVKKAVITVPAYFSDTQRQATREAGEIAGLEVVRIINEPTAAALAYEARHGVSKRILVYDLGGGTFDVSVVSMEDEVVEVLASHGNNKLGGDDFDACIVEHLVDHIRATHGIDVSESRQTMARINRIAEAAKRALSDQPYARIEEEYIAEKDNAPVHLSLELSRVEYEEMIAGYVDETFDAIHKALSGAHLTTSDVDEILLVGGSTRTPVISERLFEEFRLEPQRNVDPDLCVALGAAIQAASIAGDTVSSVLVDITPYTFGTSAMGEYQGDYYPYVYVPIVRKNSPLPVSKTEAFYTMVDGQQEVRCSIYQGEDEDALSNIKIGEFMVTGLRDVPSGNVITVRLDLDINGILHVSATEKETGLEKSITIDNAIGRFQADELEKARLRVSALFGASVEQLAGGETIEVDALPGQGTEKTQALIIKARQLMEKASEEDKEDIINFLEQINDAMQRNDGEALKKASDSLVDVLFYLEN
jgi:molecular chaperone DnaK (HSP70)